MESFLTLCRLRWRLCANGRLVTLGSLCLLLAEFRWDEAHELGPERAIVRAPEDLLYLWVEGRMDGCERGTVNAARGTNLLHDFWHIFRRLAECLLHLLDKLDELGIIVGRKLLLHL